MAKYEWSPEQTAAIETESSVIVSAGAGAGKTTLMIERMIRLMRAGTGIDRMLAVTFAVAQAEDMRAKLGNRLAELLAADLPESERARLKECYYRLPSAEICTLHKFCADTVRRYFYLTDTGADFKIADETDTALRRAGAVRSVIEEELAAGDPTFLFLYDALSARRSERDLAAAVWAVADLAATLADPEQLTAATENAAVRADAFLEEFRSVCAEDAAAWLDEYAALMRDVGEDYLADYAREYADRAEAAFGRTTLSTKPLRTPKERKNDPLFEKRKAELDGIRKTVKRAGERLSAAFSAPETDQPYARLLLGLADRTRARYDELKVRDGALDFNDLERKCLEILSAAGDEIRARYQAIFVDEYQDINPIQQAILSALDGGRTFYVGDVKQSIYAFRLCDPSIFLERFSIMREQGRAYYLNRNYRSSPKILRFCDHVFSGLMTERFGGADYERDAKFVPAKEDAPESGVELVLLDTSETRSRSEALRADRVYRLTEDNAAERLEDGAAREGRAIAERIAECMRTLRVKEGAGERALNYGDICILTRAVKGTEGLANALRDCGVPVCVKTDCDLFRSVHVRALLDLFRVVLNPKQDFPLVAVMKKFFSFTDDDLAKIRLAHPYSKTRGEFYRATEAYSENDDIFGKLNRMRAVLRDLRVKSTVMKPSEVLEEGIRATNFYVETLTAGTGLTEYRLVKRFLEAVKKCAYDTELCAFLEYADAEPELTVEVSDGGADAVTLSSVHKAKGLEYEVVFFACAGKEFNRRDERAKVFVSKYFGVVLRDYSEENREVASNRLTEACAIASGFHAREEEARVLYVALTRAKTKLYIVGRTPCDKARYKNRLTTAISAQNALEWILGALTEDMRIDGGNGSDRPIESGVYRSSDAEYRITRIQEEPVTERARVPALGVPDPGLTERIASALSYRYPYLPHAAKTTATELNEAFRRVTHGGAARASAEEDATQVGNAYHAVMQYADFTAESATDMIGALVASGKITSAQAESVDPVRVERAIRALRTRAVGETIRELAFVSKFDSETLYNEPGDGVIVQGIADLLIREEDGWTLIDYKTSAMSASALVQAYELQLAVYRDALRRAGYDVRRAYVYSFALDALVEIPDVGVREAANRRLDRHP